MPKPIQDAQELRLKYSAEPRFLSTVRWLYSKATPVAFEVEMNLRRREAPKIGREWMRLG